jgi:uncharacterized phage-like protein YoqJ
MVVVGVTGHRFLADADRIAAGVAEALDRIIEAFQGESLRIVSSLAEGADRLVTRHILRHPNSQLAVVLPLPKSDYLTDFQSAESKQEFVDFLDRADEVVELHTAGTREEAYEAAGRYMLDHCDILVAVWDERDAQGQGGTSDLVSEARKRGLPIAWVNAGNRKPGTNEPTTLGEDQGKVSFERFPHRGADKGKRRA